MYGEKIFAHQILVEKYYFMINDERIFLFIPIILKSIIPNERHGDLIQNSFQTTLNQQVLHFFGQFSFTLLRLQSAIRHHGFWSVQSGDDFGSVTLKKIYSSIPFECLRLHSFFS